VIFDFGTVKRSIAKLPPVAAAIMKPEKLQSGEKSD
jgi:hypothetical protein